MLLVGPHNHLEAGQQHSHLVDEKSDVPGGQETHPKTQGKEEKMQSPCFSSRHLLEGFNTTKEWPSLEDTPLRGAELSKERTEGSLRHLVEMPYSSSW